MKSIYSLLLVAVLGAFVSIGTARGQSFADASALLERAVHAETISGDIDRAIVLYRQVAESASASRPDVARALVALGRSYELTGSGEAVSVYRRLVSEFPDQPEAFLKAQEALRRLAAAGPSRGSAGPVSGPELELMMADVTFGVNAGPWGREFDISPDGSTIVFAAPPTPVRARLYPDLENELYFVKTGSTVMHPVIEDASEWVGANYNRWLPRWSPDGRQLLFVARMKGSERPTLARRDLGSNTTVILPAVESGNSPASNSARLPGEWLPDSRRFIAMGRNGFDLYSLDGTLLRHFETDVTGSRRLGGVSPDGRYVAYLQSYVVSGATFHFNVWLVDLNSGEQLQVTHDEGTENSGMKGFPVWSRDSRTIYYTGADNALYRKAILSNAEADRITSYSNASVMHPLILPGTGKLTFMLDAGSSTVVTAQAAAPQSVREVVRGYLLDLSPDGRTLYYWDGMDGTGETKQTTLWSLGEDKTPRRLLSGSRSDLYSDWTALSPDGSQIAFFRSIEEGSVLCTIPSRGGTEKRLITTKVGWGKPAWSPDSQEIAFVDGPDLLVVPAAGGASRSVASAAGGWYGDDIHWSPDGRYVAGFGYLTDPPSESGFANTLYAASPATGEVRQLTSPTDSTYKEGPSWHPDSRRISYLAGRPVNYRTDIVSVDGGPARTLIFSKKPDHWAGRWSPDGRYYFLSSPDFDLFSVADDGKVPQPFAQPPGVRNAWYPSFSADGSVVAWTEFESHTQLWSMTNFE